MRVIGALPLFCLVAVLVAQAGCVPPEGTALPQTNRSNAEMTRPCACYAPARVDILPLTEFAEQDSGPEQGIRAYVSLLDASGCQMKAPGKFRFELYQYLPRSAEPKGKRLKIWPDFDLSEPASNNLYWRDFLRAYEFSPSDLPFEPGPSDYILEVTCLTLDARRLTAEYLLRPDQ